METNETSTDQPTADVTPAPTSTTVVAPQLMAAAFKAATDAASTDAARAVLEHVRVTATVADDGATIELQGCDSYRLQTVTVGVAAELAAIFGPGPMLLHRTFMLAAAKLMAAKSVRAAVVTVETVDGPYGGGRTVRRVTVSVDGASVTADEYEADWPNTAVLRFDPATGVPAVAGFDPVKVAAICKSAGYFGDRRSSPILIFRGHRPQGESVRIDSVADNPALRPAIWTAAGDGWTFEALLMPVRLP